MTDFPALPTSANAASAGWLAWALSSRFPEAGTITVTPVGEVHGAATKLAYDIAAANPVSTLPQRVWIKGGWEAHSAMMTEMGCFAREAWFYEHVASKIDMRTPRSLYTAGDSSGQGVVVMDDLLARGARLWACATPASVTDVMRGVEALARLHALDLSPQLAGLIPLDSTVTGEAARQWTDAFDEAYLATEIAGARGAGMPDYAKRPDLVLACYHRMIAELSARPEVLLHGDCHPGNTFSDADDAVGFYDWQTVSLGPWAFDVSYFIVASLSVEDRRTAEVAILQRYLEAFRRAGGTPPGWAQAWTDYRKYIAYPLYVWMSVPAAYQPAQASLALTTRFSAAAADFDFFSLWS